MDTVRTAVEDRLTSFDTRLAAIEAKLDDVMATLMSPSRYDLTAGLDRPGLNPFHTRGRWMAFALSRMPRRRTDCLVRSDKK